VHTNAVALRRRATHALYSILYLILILSRIRPWVQRTPERYLTYMADGGAQPAPGYRTVVMVGDTL